MKQFDKKVDADRRSFLKFAGAGTVAGGAALVSSVPAQAAVQDQDTRDGRYQETEHVRRFYELSRF